MIAFSIALVFASANPWDVTGTSSIAAVPEPPPTHRVEHRLFQKKEHLFLRTGFAYLSRGDFYTNPGIGVDVSWYPLEVLGIDVVSATFFFSQLTESAESVRKATGFLPDTHKPIARVTTGARGAIAYGKLLVEQLDTVVHIDASVALHVGLLATDRSTNLAGDVGFSLQVRALQRMVVWFEAGWFVSYEKRMSSDVASGLLGTAGVGWML